MINRYLCTLGVRLAAAGALLVAMMASPVRPLSMAGDDSGLNCLRRNFGIPKPRSSHPHRLPSAPRHTGLVRVKALASECQQLHNWKIIAASRLCQRGLVVAAQQPQRCGTDPLGFAAHPLRC